MANAFGLLARNIGRRITNYLHGKDVEQRLVGTSAPVNSVFGAGIGGISASPPPAWALPKPGTANKNLKLVSSGRGRQTFPAGVTTLGSMAWLPRRRTIASVENLDLTTLAPEQIIDICADSDPQISLAAWNWVRLCNSGYTAAVKNKTGERDDPVGQRLIDELLDRINPRAGGVDSLLNTLTLVAFLQGAICVEAPPLAGLSGIEDVYPVNPSSIRFQWVNLGTSTAPNLQLGMQQYTMVHQAIWLNPVQVFYVPLDAMVDDPYGRAPALAAAGPTLFWHEVLRDLRRALHVAAWGRLNFTVVEEAIRNNAPAEAFETDEEYRAFLQSVIENVQNEYNKLEPDDAIIHYDSVTVDHLDTAGQMFNTERLIQAIETLIIRGTKQLPILMGGASHAGAGQLGSLEYQIQSTAVEAFQKMIASVMEAALELHLRLNGRQSRVQWNWNSIRTTDRLKDAQAAALEINNAIRMQNQGWIDQREAAISNTGHEPDLPEPPKIIAPPSASPPPMPTNAQNPMDGKQPDSKHPTALDSTKEGGDQAGAPKPAGIQRVAELVGASRNGH